MEWSMTMTAWPQASALGHGRLDVLGFGEPLVLLQPPEGAALGSARRLDVHVAGAELNACAAVASLGGSAALCTRLGDDPLASYVRRHAQTLGVGLEARTHPTRPTGVFFKDAQNDGVRRVHYYRSGSAAAAMTPEDAERGLALRPRAVVVSGLTAALGDGPRSVLTRVGELAAGRGSALVVDVNLRPQLGSLNEAVSTLQSLIPIVDLLIVGTDEAPLVLGVDEPGRIIDAALSAGCREVVVKAGAEGCWWMDDDGTPHHLASRAVTVVDPVGAGDAFTGGYLAARLAGASREASATVGSELASRVIARTGDTEGLPSPADGNELLAALATTPRPEASADQEPRYDTRRRPARSTTRNTGT